MVFMAAKLATWICIVLFFIELRMTGRIVIVVLTGISIALPFFGNGDSVYMLHAIGFVIRAFLAICYLIYIKLPHPTI